MKKMLAVTFLLVAGETLAADNFPTVGLLYNTKDLASLTYKCAPKSEGQLHCDFVQTSVRRKTNPESAAADIERVLKEYRAKPEKMPQDQCKEWATILDILEGRKPAPKKDAMAKMTDVEKRDVTAQMKAILAFCRAPSEYAYRRVLEVAHDKESRTCKVSSNSFSQIFKRVSDQTKTGTSWVVDSQPSGPCGLVELSRFEREGQSTFAFWQYFAKKAVTNRKGKFLTKMACTDFDEDEYEYSWRGSERPMMCDYIEFSAL